MKNNIGQVSVDCEKHLSSRHACTVIAKPAYTKPTQTEKLKSIYPSDLENAIFPIIPENCKKEVVTVIASFDSGGLLSNV